MDSLIGPSVEFPEYSGETDEPNGRRNAPSAGGPPAIARVVGCSSLCRICGHNGSILLAITTWGGRNGYGGAQESKRGSVLQQDLEPSYCDRCRSRYPLARIRLAILRR